ncbi:MAG: hypothetical protein QM610_01555 [Chitinophagaceae bacterium]
MYLHKIVVATAILSLSTACNNATKDSTTNTADTTKISPLLPPKDTQQQKAIDAFRQKALDDYNTKQLKYYFQSLGFPSRNVVQYCKDSLQVTIVPAIDVIRPEFSAYNKVVDSIILSRKGHTLSDYYLKGRQ